MKERIAMYESDFSTESKAIWAWYWISTVVIGVVAGNVFKGSPDSYSSDSGFSWEAFWFGAFAALVLNIPLVAIFTVLKKIAINVVETRVIAIEAEVRERKTD
jgi:hypothetical protein